MSTDYWRECLVDSAESNGVALTPEQAIAMAWDVERAHDLYGQYHYTPPWSDRFEEIERGYKAKVAELERGLRDMRHTAEGALQRALGVHDEVCLGNDGSVCLRDGRSTQIL